MMHLYGPRPCFHMRTTSVARSLPQTFYCRQNNRNNRYKGIVRPAFDALRNAHPGNVRCFGWDEDLLHQLCLKPISTKGLRKRIDYHQTLTVAYKSLGLPVKYHINKVNLFTYHLKTRQELIWPAGDEEKALNTILKKDKEALCIYEVNKIVEMYRQAADFAHKHKNKNLYQRFEKKCQEYNRLIPRLLEKRREQDKREGMISFRHQICGLEDH